MQRDLKMVAGASLTTISVRVAIFLAALAFVVGIACQFEARNLLDDAFMFVRYADHWLHGNGISWNAKDGPCYGLTSQLYLAVVAGLRPLVADPMLVLLLASSLVGALFVVFMTWLGWRASPRELRGFSMLFLWYSFAQRGLLQWGSVENVPAIGIGVWFVRGMDTSLSLLGVAILIAVWRGLHADPRWLRAALVGAFSGILYSVRPDLLVFPYAVAGWVFLSGGRPGRRVAAAVLLVQTLCVASQLLLAKWYYDSSLPLSFYCKSGLKFYGPEMREVYENVNARQLTAFLATNWPSVGCILAVLTAKGRRWVTGLQPFELGLLLGSMAFCGYYFGFVTQIMHGNQRFYAPTFPVLLYLAVRALPLLLLRGRQLRSKPWLHVAGCSLIAAHSVFLAWANVREARSMDMRSFRKQVFGVSLFEELPDDLVIAGTEVGFLGVASFPKRFIDLAALNDTEFAHGEFSPQRLFAKDRPDLLYFPHPHYKTMRKQITEHLLFAQDYKVVRHPDFPWQIAIRRKSPYFGRILQELSGKG